MRPEATDNALELLADSWLSRVLNNVDTAIQATRRHSLPFILKYYYRLVFVTPAATPIKIISCAGSALAW
jgi:hypothetical protein